MLDPYKILGVGKDATDEEIKKSYRELTKKYHPDLNAGSKEAENKFKELGEAYELISNKDSREKFSQSQTETTGQERPFYHQTQNPDSRYRRIFEEDNEDLFSSLFRSQAQARNRDSFYSLEITVDETLHGTTKEIALPNGKELKVKIPKGIAEGIKLRFKGHGETGGDAYVEIHYKSSKRFKIEGEDLISELPINLDEALHGTQLDFMTIEGPILLKIPAGVNSGFKLKIKGKGLLRADKKSRGDQYILVTVMLPSKPDTELSSLIKKWIKEHPYNPRSEAS